MLNILKIILIIFTLVAGFFSPVLSAVSEPPEWQGDMVLIQTGAYTPLFKQETDQQEIPVDAFYLDRYLVSNREFVEFTELYPRWHPDNIKPVFSDKNYLNHLKNQPLEEQAGKPVINVSWFAARAYCDAHGKRLPSVAEWEYAAMASETDPDGSKDPAYRQRILEWYSKPATAGLPDVKQTEPNYWGVYGMHGVVWELVNDFNTALVTGESRGDSQLENQLFCGAGAASSVDPGDYAAFMRYAMRSSYEASYSLSSMGFRCAADADLIVDKGIL